MQESKTHQQVRPALCVEAQTVKQPKSSLRCNTTQLPGGLSSCGSEGSEKARAGQGGREDCGLCTCVTSWHVSGRALGRRIRNRSPGGSREENSVQGDPDFSCAGCDD